MHDAKAKNEKLKLTHKGEGDKIVKWKRAVWILVSEVLLVKKILSFISLSLSLPQPQIYERVYSFASFLTNIWIAILKSQCECSFYMWQKQLNLILKIHAQ